MTKTKSQKQRAKARRAVGGKPTGGARKPRGSQPRRQRQAAFIGPRLSKAARRGRAQRRAVTGRKMGGGDFIASSAGDGINRTLKMHNDSVIRERFNRRMEKVTDITIATQSFAVNQALYLNPGNSVLFPIFSQIAAVYEQWKCHFLKFHFVTQAYTASGSNVAAGKIIMATNYDPSDSQFAGSTQMENYTNSDKDAPFCSFSHDVMNQDHDNAVDPLKTYFVNPSANAAAPTSDSTSKFFDLGLFQLASSGLPTASSTEYGELYVEYEFEMIRVKQQTPLGQSLIAAHYSFVPTNTSAFAGSAQKSGSNMALTFANTSVAIPVVGRFLCTYFANAATSFTRGGAPVASTNATLVAAWAYGNDDAVSGNGTTNIGESWVVDISAPGGLVTFAAPTIVGAATGDLWVSQVPSGLSMDEKKEEKEEILTLKNQVKELGAMMRALLVRIPDDEEKELEILPNPRSSRGNGEVVERGRGPIRDSSGQVTPLTTPSDKASKPGWF